MLAARSMLWALTATSNRAAPLCTSIETFTIVLTSARRSPVDRCYWLEPIPRQGRGTWAISTISYMGLCPECPSWAARAPYSWVRFSTMTHCYSLNAQRFAGLHMGFREQPFSDSRWLEYKLNLYISLGAGSLCKGARLRGA